MGGEIYEDVGVNEQVFLTVCIRPVMLTKRTWNAENRTQGAGSGALVNQLPKTVSSDLQPLPISMVPIAPPRPVSR